MSAIGYGLFQSTRPAWGATKGRAGSEVGIKVSIHAPRVGRDGGKYETDTRRSSFNPRAPRGARPQESLMPAAIKWFQSTRPAWGATQVIPALGGGGVVSIHAPRVGRDILSVNCILPEGGFNPRAPRGARLPTSPNTSAASRFQSTRPAWGATQAQQELLHDVVVSIHAPRVGRDVALGLLRTNTPQFQSTRPAWGATQTSCGLLRTLEFQSTRPAWGATRCGFSNLHLVFDHPTIAADEVDPF